MFSVTKKPIARILISLLFAVYLTLLLKTHFNPASLIPYITGIVVFAISYFLSGSIINSLTNRAIIKRAAYLGIGLAIVIMIAAPKSVNPGNVPHDVGLIKITALGEKNEKSQGTEVWIKNIYNGGAATNLSTVPLADDWEEKYNQIVSYRKQPATQEIIIKYPGPYEIELMKHGWSGKVKIEDGKNSTIIDLYKKDLAESYTYTGTSTIPIKDQAGKMYQFGITALTLITLSLFWFLIFAYVQVKNDYFLLPIPLSVFVFFLSDYFPLTYTGKFLALAASIGAYLLTRTLSLGDYANTFTKKQKAFFFAAIVYGSFAFVGHQLFLAGYPLREVGYKIAYFVLFGGWLTFISIAFLYFTEFVRNKISEQNVPTIASGQNKSPVKLYFTFMAIMVAWWLVYLIAFFPANMSADSLDQWEQATYGSPLNNWHPVFHTLFNRLCLTIYKSPASIAMGQILFMAAVMSGWLLFLYQKGIPAKWLKWAAVIIALIPANGIMAVTLWKDVPFTISLVWLTLAIAKIVTNDAYFKQRSAYFEATIALVAACLFRHNGMLVYLLAVAGLLLYYFKTRKTGILVCVALSMALVGSYFVYISNPDRVVPNPPAVKLVAPIDGIAAVLYHKGNLSAETRQEMYKILPDSTWRSHYRPFSADEYLFFTNMPFVENLSKLSTSQVLHLYLNTLAKNPYLVIRDRLNGSEIVWNVLEANGSFNYRYCHVIDPNPFGIHSPDSLIKKVLEHFLELSVKIADPFLWRAGIFNFLTVLLLLSMMKQRKWFLLLFIPVIGTNISLLLSMTLQNFRYVYYVPIIFGFIWLLSISTIMAREKTKTNYQN